jgi:hypothetical protein
LHVQLPWLDNGEIRVKFLDWDTWSSAFISERGVPLLAPTDPISRDRREQEVKELPGLLQTWFGRLRNVRTVEVTGVPPECAHIIRERCHGSTELDLLPERYETLERNVSRYRCCEESLKRALLACEAEDTEGFGEALRAVLNPSSTELMDATAHHRRQKSQCKRLVACLGVDVQLRSGAGERMRFWRGSQVRCRRGAGTRPAWCSKEVVEIAILKHVQLSGLEHFDVSTGQS